MLRPCAVLSARSGGMMGWVSRLGGLLERQHQILTDMLFRNVPGRRKFDMAAQLAFAFKHLVFVRQGCALAKFQRNVLCVGENATDWLPSGKQDAAILHFFKDGRCQILNDFPKRLNQLESGLIEQAYVFEKFGDAVSSHGIRTCSIA